MTKEQLKELLRSISEVDENQEIRIVYTSAEDAENAEKIVRTINEVFGTVVLTTLKDNVLTLRDYNETV